MSGLDPSILLASRTPDLSSLAASLDPATIYAKGLTLRKQRQDVGEEGRILAQNQMLRDAASKVDLSTPEGQQSFLQTIQSNPATADRYLDAAKAFTAQQEAAAQASTSQTGAEEAAAKKPLILNYVKRFLGGAPAAAPVNPNAPLDQKLLRLKSLSMEDEAAKTFGLPVPPDNAIAYQQAAIQAKQGIENALTNGTDAKGVRWADRIAAIPPGKTNVASNLYNEFKGQHPEIAYLPEDDKKTYQSSFVAPQQPNMATVITQASGGSGGFGATLAQQVAQGNLGGKDAIGSILGNRFMLPAAKQKELVALASSVPKLGGKYTIPQLAVFAKNSMDPAINRQTIAIDALTPNIDKLIQLSDQNGRVNAPLLNKMIQQGEFQGADGTVTNMQELQGIIAEEAGRVFGGSATSDFKIKLGGSLVDLSLGQDNFRSNMGILKTAMDNKKRALNDAQGPYSPWHDEQATTGGTANDAVIKLVRGADNKLHRVN